MRGKKDYLCGPARNPGMHELQGKELSQTLLYYCA